MSISNNLKLNSYERIYKKQLSQDQLDEIKHNLIGFFGLLVEIDQENKINRLSLPSSHTIKKENE